VLLATQGGLVAAALSGRLIVGIGTCSYSIYLIHEPLIRLVFSLTEQLHWSQLVSFLVYQGVVGPGCIIVGCLFFLVAERPFLTWQERKHASRRVRVVAAAPSLAPLQANDDQPGHADRGGLAVETLQGPRVGP
jgi:peptidoglycan/LPS O-acetylase OafA/YrhL